MWKPLNRLQDKIQTMQSDHHRELMKLEAKHQSELNRKEAVHTEETTRLKTSDIFRKAVNNIKGTITSPVLTRACRRH